MCRRSLWQRVDNRLQLFKAVYMPLLAFLTGAFACSFLGNIWSTPGDDRVASGLELRKAGSILFSIAVIALFIVVMYAIVRGAVVEQRRDPIIIQILLVLPFMLVRNVAAAFEAFLSNPNQPYFNPFVDFGFIRLPDLAALAILSVLGVTKLRRDDRKEMKRIAYDRRQQIEQERRAGHSETAQPKPSFFKRLFKRAAVEEDKADVAEAPAPTS
jgi:hypothetical protein